MGILDRLFGATQSQPTVTSVRLRGGPTVNVVGESNYRDAIGRAVGGHSRDGVEHDCEAMLVANPSNPYDSNAVEVRIGAELVGYLPREAALAYQPVARRLAAANQVGIVQAHIRGGWNRSARDRGDYGIKLDMAAPDRLL